MLGQARGVKSRGSYGLRWTDVDVEAQTISIESTRVVVDGVVVEGGTRSETSTRVFAAHPRAVGSAQGRSAMQAEEQLAAGPPASAAASWSPTPVGRRYHPDTVSDYGAAACAKAGVKRIRLHDARHTCGTLMHLEHNVPVGWPPIGHGTRWNPCEQAGRGERAWTAERRWRAAMRPGVLHKAATG